MGLLSIEGSDSFLPKRRFYFLKDDISVCFIRAKQLHELRNGAKTPDKGTWAAHTFADRSKICRVAGLECSGLSRPFRAPHHTVSTHGLLGSYGRGWDWRPGEITLAHGGTLYLDGVEEFPWSSLEIVRSAWQRCECGLRGFTAPGWFDLILHQREKEWPRMPLWVREAMEAQEPYNDDELEVLGAGKERIK